MSEAEECKKLFCQEQSYMKINYEEERVECLECHPACLSCYGGGRTDCYECKKNYLSLPGKNKGENAVCKKCEEINIGYYTAANGTCQGSFPPNSIEVCGDGINLGMRECDDGNTIDGDGCSSICTVEKGFECVRQVDGADICRDVVLPSAKLTVRKGNVLEVLFSETVYSSLSSTSEL